MKFNVGDCVDDRLTRLQWRVRKRDSSALRYLCCRNSDGVYQTEWFDEAELIETPPAPLEDRIRSARERVAGSWAANL